MLMDLGSPDLKVAFVDPNPIQIWFLCGALPKHMTEPPTVPGSGIFKKPFILGFRLGIAPTL